MTIGKLKVLSAAALIAVAGAVQAAVSQPRHVTIEYEYAKDGEIVSRKVNGAVQRYEYDLRGQLTGVYDGNGKAVESYTYDAAGNILKKTVNGKTTTFKYDAANQLVSKEDVAGLVTYAYDAAGRMVREGDKEYRYSYLDKITSVLESGETTATMDYFVGGQIASVTRGNEAEKFIWDGLALVHRDGSDYLNEPAIGGGNPIASDGKVMLNDMLGSTVAVKGDEGYSTTSMTAFGESSDTGAFFTGKPFVGELGYAFLMRSYRPENGKWQTADPVGYPDGWNQLAYCNNGVISSIDLYGALGVVATEPQKHTFDGKDYYKRWPATSTPAAPFQDPTPHFSDDGLFEYYFTLMAEETKSGYKNVTPLLTFGEQTSFYVFYYDGYDENQQPIITTYLYTPEVKLLACIVSDQTITKVPGNGTKYSITATFSITEGIKGDEYSNTSTPKMYSIPLSYIVYE